MPQDLAIYPDLTGRENLMFFARLYSMPTPEAKRRTDEVLALTCLADRAGDQTKQYSGGMKRRLNIGIGLLHQPKLLILDEPTVGVDPQSRNAILESVEGLSGGSPTPPRRPGATTPSPGSSATARPSPASCRSLASSRPMPPCC